MGYTLSSSPSSSGALVQHLHLLGHQFLQKKKKNVSRQQDVDGMLKLLEKSTSPSFDMNPISCASTRAPKRKAYHFGSEQLQH